jgi:hypothetical protein
MSDENADDGEYGFFTTDGGETVVYDRENPEAWIQSSYSVAVGTATENETSA